MFPAIRPWPMTQRGPPCQQRECRRPVEGVIQTPPCHGPSSVSSSVFAPPRDVTAAAAAPPRCTPLPWLPPPVAPSHATRHHFCRRCRDPPPQPPGQSSFSGPTLQKICPPPSPPPPSSRQVHNWRTCLSSDCSSRWTDVTNTMGGGPHPRCLRRCCRCCCCHR